MIRLLALLVFGVLALLVLAILLGAIVSVAKLVRRMGRALLFALATGGAALLLGAQAEVAGPVALAGFVAGLLTGRRNEPVPRRSASPPQAEALHDQEPAAEGPQAFSGDAYWAQAMRLAPRRRKVLQRAQADCEALLRVFDRNPSPDPELLKLAALIRRHGPQIVAEAAESRSIRRSAQSRAAADAMVAQLVMLGEQADACLARLQDGVREKQALRERHLDTRLAE